MPTKIEWCDETLNPLGWGCYGPTGTAENPQPCSYCYAKRLADRRLRKCPQCQAFVPHWHPEELDKPLHWKRPRRVFLQSMGDMFGPWVTLDHFDEIIRATQKADQHTYYVLTKQAEHIACKLNGRSRQQREYNWYGNLWLGVSVTCDADLWRIDALREAWSGHKFVSFEPLYRMDEFPNLTDVEWVILGSQTAPVRETPFSDSATVIHAARQRGIPVFVKRNLKPNPWAYDDSKRPQEFPNE